jgi:hypothetical protein
MLRLAEVIANGAPSTTTGGAEDPMTSFYTVLGAIGFLVLGWIGSLIVKRYRTPTTYEALALTVGNMQKTLYGDGEPNGDPGVVKRLAEAERRDAVKGRIIRQVAGQWPHGHSLYLNPDDLAELDEAILPIDHEWRVKP